MSAPEKTLNQYDTGSPFEDTVYFDVATNLTACAVLLCYAQVEGEAVARSAVVASASPSTSAATSAVLRRNLSDEDVETPGFYRYEWRITLANDSVLIRPLSAATPEFPERKRPTFEVAESISSQNVEEDEDEIMAANRPLVVADIAEMKALPAPTNSNYRLVIVMSDENEQRADFEFDASIDADSIPDGEYVLTAGGGFRRKGV